MTAVAGDLQLSAAGIDQGHKAFQEFLLAGERHIVMGFARPGSEKTFAKVYAQLPDREQSVLGGYFARQARLDLSQRVALMGPFVKLDISTTLTPGLTRRAGMHTAAIRSELDSLGARRFEGRGAAFTSITGAVADAVADAGVQVVKPVKPTKFAPRFVELMLDEIIVENSQDDTWFTNDTDEVSLGVTMLNETAEVTTAKHNLGSISEGNGRKLAPALVLGSMPVDTSIPGYPRQFSFKVDAVDRDDGGYNEILAAGADYIQEKVTEELIAAGLIKLGGALGIPVPPVVANYLASYLKTWFDDLLDWFAGLLKNNDDILGSKTRTVVLNGAEFALREVRLWNIFDPVVLTSDKGPLEGSPFTWTFSGSDGRWRTTMHVRLR